MSDGMRGKTMPVITQELMIHRVCTQQMLQGTLRVTKSIKKKAKKVEVKIIQHNTMIESALD